MAKAIYRVNCNLNLQRNQQHDCSIVSTIVITKKQKNSWIDNTILLLLANKEILILTKDRKWKKFSDLTEEENIFPLSWELQNFIDAIFESLKYLEFWTVFNEIQVASTQILIEV